MKEIAQYLKEQHPNIPTQYISHSTNDLFSIIIITYEDAKHLTISHNSNNTTTLDCTIHTHHEHYHLTTIDLKDPNSLKELSKITN